MCVTAVWAEVLRRAHDDKKYFWGSTECGI